MKTWYRQPSSAAGSAVRDGADLQGNPDQAVALRRRRLRHPMVALARSLEQPRQRVWADGRMRGSRSRSAPTSISRSRPTTSATPSSMSRAPSQAHSAAPNPASSAWSACSPISFRARSISAVNSAPPGVTGGDRRLSRQRLPLDAAGNAGRICKAALDLGIILFAGEGEGRMADAAARHRQRHDQADLQLSRATCRRWRRRRCRSCRAGSVTRVAGHYTSFDAGRGCPFQCSFCTIINVQGRKSRYRTPDDVEAIVRANAAQGITRFFVTDDNFARNRNWEADPRPPDRAARAATTSTSSSCCRSTRSATAFPNFIEKAARAGCTAVFIGLENINPESLMGTKKRQNKIWEYREMLQAWQKRQGDDLRRATSSASRPTRRNRSRATSRSSRRSCRSISWNSSS